MSKPKEPHMALVIAAVGRARQNVPWPIRRTLPDGDTQYAGLTEDEVSEHIGREVIRELMAMSLPDDLVHDAARAVFKAESELLAVPVDEAHFKASVASYRTAALIGFRSILAEFLVRGVR